MSTSARAHLSLAEILTPSVPKYALLSALYTRRLAAYIRCPLKYYAPALHNFVILSLGVLFLHTPFPTRLLRETPPPIAQK